MKAKLGIAPIAWTNDDLPELGGETTLERCLEEARIAGFSGIEIGGKFPRKPEILKPILNRYNISLCGGWYSGTLLQNSIDVEKEKIASQMLLFKKLKAPCIVYGETSYTIQNLKKIPLCQKRILSEKEIINYGQKLSEFALWCKNEGMPISFHHHMGTVIETEDELNLLMENTSEELSLLFDPGHMAFAGGDVNRVLSNHGKRISHFHAKDVRNDVIKNLDRNGDSFLDAVLKGAFTVPGDGSLNFKNIVNKLYSLKYQGWFVVEAEQDPQKAPPLEYAKKGYNEMKNCLINAGYKIVE